MQNFNYHSHTKRCEHAIGEDEEYVKAAIANGFQVMGFSDHAPYAGVHTPGERMDKEALEGYIASVKALQKKYEKEIEIRIGLEFEYFEDQLLELLEYRDRFDYMIIGQHGPALYEPEFYEANTDEDVLRYANLIRKACEKGLPDIIAHPDLFMFSNQQWTPACEEAARIICQSACDANIPIEINLNGLKYGKRQIGEEWRYTYPYRAFWKVAEQYPVDVVYGLDAHTPEKYADKKCFEIVDHEIVYGLNLHKRTKLMFEKKL